MTPPLPLTGAFDTAWSVEAWRRSAPHLKAALAGHDTHKLGDVLRLIEAGQAQFWPCEKSAAVTEIVAYPQHRAVRIWLAGGVLEELKALEPEIVRWAYTQHGCTRSEIVGRDWRGALEGYEKVAVVLRKEISP